MAETMRETIARAIYGPDDYPALPWDEANARDREDAFATADRVLDALAEPTSGMARRMCDASDLLVYAGIDTKEEFEAQMATAFRAAIAAAKEGK